MTVRLVVALLLLGLLPGCRTTREVRLETGQGEPIVHALRAEGGAPVAMGQEEFSRAMAQQARTFRPPANPEQEALRLFEVAARSGWYRYSKPQGVVPEEDGKPTASEVSPADKEMTRLYLALCASRGTPGDCKKLLVSSSVITQDGRYALAMSFAVEQVCPEMMNAFKGMVDPEAIKASLYWTMTVYALLWLVPEPVSKVLAAGITISLVGYLGWDTFWTLIAGWRRLVEEVDGATTFAQIREAGERFGKVMGRQGARAFALLLMAAIGQTVSSFAAKVPTLPGSAQASVQAGAQVGIGLSALAEVETVAVTADAVTIALSPGAVVSTAHAMIGAAVGPVDGEGRWHHIATDKWLDATHSGGPWTPKFQEIFDRAGMSLNDPANQVQIKGHVGPHPEEYHREVYERLDNATSTCRTVEQCRGALIRELQKLAEEIATPGSKLNKLVTRAK